MGLGIKTGQEQFIGQLTEKEIKNTIDNGNPFGVLYGENYFNASIGENEWSGHWVVGVGYATAQGHDFLVVSNDPAGGIQRIQTYDDFKGNYVGDTNPWRPWVDTAL